MSMLDAFFGNFKSWRRFSGGDWYLVRHDEFAGEMWQTWQRNPPVNEACEALIETERYWPA